MEKKFVDFIFGFFRDLKKKCEKYLTKQEFLSETLWINRIGFRFKKIKTKYTKS